MNTRLHPLQLALGIALGLWLGFIAIGLTGWLAWRQWGPQVAAPLAAVTRLATPPAAAPTGPGNVAPPAAPASSEAMFQQYQQNLHSQELRQVERAARADASNQGNPQCQFWLEQSRNAPNEQNRENVARFCN
ncbi:hypothetical protein [Pseudomonas sp. NPDC007930]|uniref:hypothetical protein n=1 Tax=Pseudomonas sp. NPDC007930 TaxID=3364417 RepID=UPI0036E135B0